VRKGKRRCTAAGPAANAQGRGGPTLLALFRSLPVFSPTFFLSSACFYTTVHVFSPTFFLPSALAPFLTLIDVMAGGAVGYFTTGRHLQSSFFRLRLLQKKALGRGAVRDPVEL
jgi:hypothetical protein